MSRQQVTGKPAAPGKQSKRERRARLAKEEIVEAALELLRRRSDETLSFERVAEAMHVSPMSLYLHMGNRQSLLDAVADHVLSAFRVENDRAAPWQQQVSVCVEATFRLIRESPAPLLLFMRPGSGNLPGWAHVVAEFGHAISALPLEDEARARVLRWLTRTAVQLAISEAAFPSPTTFLGLAATVGGIPDAEREVLMPLLRSVAAPEESAERVDFYARRIVEGVQGVLAELRSAARPPARPISAERRAGVGLPAV